MGIHPLPVCYFVYDFADLSAVRALDIPAISKIQPPLQPLADVRSQAKC